MSNYNRKFDWDEAQRLRDQGLSYARIGRLLGVTGEAVRFAVNPEWRAKFAAYNAAYQRENKPHQGICPDCGGISSDGRYRKGARCKPCHDKHSATSVREHTLRCSACRYWLPDDDFPRAASNKQRRQRHALCRPCQNVARALNREANRERERAYERSRRTRTTA